jgi:hypothetical protein
MGTGRHFAIASPQPVVIPIRLIRTMARIQRPGNIYSIRKIRTLSPSREKAFFNYLS